MLLIPYLHIRCCLDTISTTHLPRLRDVADSGDDTSSFDADAPKVLWKLSYELENDGVCVWLSDDVTPAVPLGDVTAVVVGEVISRDAAEAVPPPPPPPP